ncbi:hypothetical protein IEU95_07330 [Hoyosella rhizosphaerae]|uniref:hypothetical protein n=1 Tax=Hoyosella rhizosphaerae TaxID=1755582 RepID=UPI00166962EF|nr:hypothetical protein [Hoyosella rhizosphaerae]MBN4926635.1 hypothetical protein [Hoyosella rhizosphaerae]
MPVRMLASATRAARDTAFDTVGQLTRRTPVLVHTVDLRPQLAVLGRIAQSGLLDPDGPLDRLLSRGGLLERLVDEEGVLEKVLEKGGPLDRLLAEGGVLDQIAVKDGLVERAIISGGPVDRLLADDGLVATVAERDVIGRLVALLHTLERFGPAVDRIVPTLDALNSTATSLQDMLNPANAVNDFVARIPMLRRKPATEIVVATR